MRGDDHSRSRKWVRTCRELGGRPFFSEVFGRWETIETVSTKSGSFYCPSGLQGYTSVAKSFGLVLLIGGRSTQRSSPRFRVGRYCCQGIECDRIANCNNILPRAARPPNCEFHSPINQGGPGIRGGLQTPNIGDDPSRGGPHIGST